MARVVKNSVRIILGINDLLRFIIDDTEINTYYVVDKLNNVLNIQVSIEDLEKEDILIKDGEISILIPASEENL